MSEQPIDTLPAKIILQVRDGFSNVLAEFDLPVYGTDPLDASDPDTEKGAKLGHKTDAGDIITGLARAQKKIVQDMRDADALAGHEEWLRSLFEWVMSA